MMAACGTSCSRFKFNYTKLLFHTARATRVSFMYDVTVTTGNKFGAGTDANVFVRLIGEKGSTDEIQLQAKKTDLERGMINTFKCPADDVGVLKKIIIRHDNSGIAPAWFLEKVYVKDNRGKMYHFECNSWIEKVESSDPILLLKESENNNLNITATKLKKAKTASQNIGVSKKADEIDDVKSETNLKNVMKTIVEDYTNMCDDVIPDTNSDEEESQSASEVLLNRHQLSLSPAVRNLIDSYGIDFFKLSGTGPYSRVLKGDVITFMEKSGVTEKVWLERQHDVQQNFSETSAPVLTLKKRFTDSTISVTQTQNATQIAQNKSSIPHMYATVKCDVTLYNQYCETLSKEYERFTSVVLLSRILCKVIREQKLFDLSNSSLDVDVTCDGEEYTLIDCHNKTIDQLLVQRQQTSGIMNSIIGINICHNYGVMQLSSVLRPGQLLNISFSSLPLTVDSNCMPKNVSLLSLTCDCSHVTETEMGSILAQMKLLIEQPALI